MKTRILFKSINFNKIIGFAIIYLLSSTALIAQNNVPTGSIKGKIVSADSLPAQYVVVKVKDLKKGTTTDSKGEFEIKHIPEGNQTIIIQILGYENLENQVVVKANEVSIVPQIWLKEDVKVLQEVIINGQRNKFNDKESDYIGRLPLSNIENPQAYNAVSKELMKEQVIVNFDDALKNAPGVNKLWTSTGRGNDGAGYFSMRGFSVQPTMINGVAGQTNGGVDPSNIERIETIKGPSGTLFGSSLISLGGLINIVTKKPYETFGGEINYTGGSYDLNRVTVDVNTPVNKQKTLFVRLNGATHYEGSFQDAGFKKSNFLAPSILYKANNRLSFTVNTEMYSSEGTNPLMVFLNRSRKLYATNIDELQFNFNRSYTSNDITVKNTTLNIFGQANYKISDKWTSQTNISRSVRKSDGYYSYIMYLQPTNDTLISRYISDLNSTSTTTNIQQNFIGDFKIGKFRNRVVAGFDILHTQIKDNSSAYVEFDKVNTANKKDSRYKLLNQQALDSKIASNTSPTKSGSESITYSAYISDVFNITPKLLVMASLRADKFVNRGSYNYAIDTVTGEYEQSSLSPKLGLVYQVIKDKVAVFGNYMNGFKNVAPITQALPDINGTFKPQNANQFEAGLKLDLLQNRLSLTSSYYDILVTNMTRSESIERDGKTYNITVQNGSQSSKGVEFDLVANPIDGLNLILGYGFNESKNVKTAATIEGRRPTSAGPKKLATAWISYSLTKGLLKGLGLGFGGNYASENKITNSAPTGEFTLPSYIVLNSGIFYNTKSYRLSLKVDNLTNEKYFTGWSTIEQQMPRRILASVAYKF